MPNIEKPIRKPIPTKPQNPNVPGTGKPGRSRGPIRTIPGRGPRNPIQDYTRKAIDDLSQQDNLYKNYPM